MQRAVGRWKIELAASRRVAAHHPRLCTSSKLKSTRFTCVLSMQAPAESGSRQRPSLADQVRLRSVAALQAFPAIWLCSSGAGFGVSGTDVSAEAPHCKSSLDILHINSC